MNSGMREEYVSRFFPVLHRFIMADVPGRAKVTVQAAPPVKLKSRAYAILRDM